VQYLIVTEEVINNQGRNGGKWHTAEMEQPTQMTKAARR